MPAGDTLLTALDDAIKAAKGLPPRDMLNTISKVLAFLPLAQQRQLILGLYLETLTTIDAKVKAGEALDPGASKYYESVTDQLLGRPGMRDGDLGGARGGGDIVDRGPIRRGL